MTDLSALFGDPDSDSDGEAPVTVWTQSGVRSRRVHCRAYTIRRRARVATPRVMPLLACAPVAGAKLCVAAAMAVRRD